MQDMTIHFRGRESERRTLPTVPAVGSYITAGGALWRVDAVVYDEAGLQVYALEVSEQLAKELTTAWAAWKESPTGKDEVLTTTKKRR
jgi:hypothetical protein